MKKQKVISIRVDEELVNDAKSICKKSNTTLAMQIRAFICKISKDKNSLIMGDE